ncbi:MAG: hypothetical protein IPN15_03855 [Saprospiraceae bacterium]|nr:hypothetical protein [Candidatus Vicinibacter affinis]
MRCTKTGTNSKNFEVYSDQQQNHYDSILEFYLYISPGSAFVFTSNALHFPFKPPLARLDSLPSKEWSMINNGNQTVKLTLQIFPNQSKNPVSV